MQHTLKSILPRRIIALRSMHHLSLRALARETGIAGSTLHTLESGFSADVLLTTILRLCEQFQVSPDYLLGVEHDPHHAHTLHLVGAAAVVDSCPICGTHLAPNEPHRLGQCIQVMHQQGASVSHLAARFGLCPASIEQVLQDEYALLRGIRAA
ncbi:MAG: helix-turn-helix domain-containing protein [Bryobacterales bacterium]|jgi:DNA-binding Xre family transcriptional regulator|nr:helix-turn-helix domain-containing protein [Bryobacterales bacterium]